MLLMTDKRSGAIAGILKGLLYILSLIYGIAILCRGIMYGLGIFKTNKVPVKVISVGNLTLGGTGKTPFVMMLAKILKENIGKETAILIRGYGWDEQAMLKKRLPEIPVFVGEDRVRASRRAVKLYGANAVVLDDGFQYWELARDLNIVLIDSRNLFGNGRLFPRGILREPKESLSRADIVVFTKVDKARTNLDTLKISLKSMNPSLVFLEAVHKPAALYDARTGEDLGLSFVKGRKAVLVSSIGDPGYFEETVKGLGMNVVEHIIFGDHHDYDEGDISRIAKRCDERSFDFILTTEKDAVKLNRMRLSFSRYRLMTLSVEMSITAGRETLIDRLNSLYSG